MSSSKNDLTQSLLAECHRKDDHIEEQNKQIKELKKEIKIYNNFLIDLHTAQWTGNEKKFCELLKRVGDYSYARTNTNGFPEEEEERAKQTLLKLDE